MDENLVAGFVSGTVQTLVGHPLDTLKVWRQQNIQKPPSLFSGMKYPLFTGSILASAQFTTAMVIGENMRLKHGYTRSQSEITGGLCAGIVSGILTAPIDKYKIQMQTRSANARYGMGSCIAREIPACGIYFGSYGELREHGYSVLVSGAFAGVLSWLCTYPLDIVKTHIQSGESPNLREVYGKMRTGQISPTNGLGFCLMRAFVINGIGFAVYEKMLLV